MHGRAAVEVMLERARANLDRVQPERLATEVANGAVVIDIRPVDQRTRDGELPGAVVIDRNVLEWRLDPTSPHRAPMDIGRQTRIIVWFATRATARAWPPPPCASSAWPAPPT